MTTRPTLVYLVTDPMSFWLIQGHARLVSRAGFDVHMISSPGELAERSSAREGAGFHPV